MSSIFLKRLLLAVEFTLCNAKMGSRVNVCE